MTRKDIKDMVASVRGRLLNLARRTGKPYDEILIYYALERFLYRLSKSPFKGQFLLKGGLLLMGKGLPQARPTRDIDLSQNLHIKVEEDISGMIYRLFARFMPYSPFPGKAAAFLPDLFNKLIQERKGTLIRKIRLQPFSLVLLDEIEKAGPEVFDIFLNMSTKAGLWTDTAASPRSEARSSS